MRLILHTYTMAGLFLLGANFAASQSTTYLNLTGSQHREAIIFANQEQHIEVCGLTLGKTYQVWLNEPGGNPVIKLLGSTQAYSPSFSFVAAQNCHEFLAKKSNIAPSKSESTTWFSIGCKDCGKKGQAFDPGKIATQGVLSPQILINDIFLGGDCYEVSNLNAIGVGLGRGSFSDGNSTIGIPNGIILCTGDIADAAGPNNDDQAGLNIGGPSTDPDLEIFATANIQDVQGIEFDFVPTGNTVSFDYVFASEEYCEFVNTGMNDLFGFFISGPGINGSFSFNGENLATVPSTNLYVTIDNVNQLDNSAFFVPNRANCGATTNMTDIQYDGWTTVLTATANVIPCEQYHIRLVIADVGDGIFDSAVFLGAGSFNAGGDPETGNIEPSTGIQNFLEGCEPAHFTFYRDTDSDINQPVLIEITLLPSSTATEGVDFGVLPASVIIPAGQDSIVLPITLIADNISEVLESIQISVANGCECSSLEYSLTISDLPGFNAILPTVEVCEGNSVNLSPTISNGITGGAYTYQWSNGQITPSINITPTDGQLITVTITDQCGTEVLASTTANVIEIPSASLSAGGGNSCLGSASDEHVFSIEITGEPNWLISYTLDGITQSPIPVTSSPFQFSTSTPGSYIFTAVSTTTANCQGVAMGAANVFLGDIQNTVATTPIDCNTLGSITIATTGGSIPYLYSWSNGLPNSPNISGLPAGSYQVTVTDGNGCTALANGTIGSVPLISAVATASPVDCNTPNAGTINLGVTGGTPPYSFAWSNGLPSTQNQIGLGTGTYTVTITDGGNCTEVASATVTATSTLPTALAQANDSLDCEAVTIAVTGQGSELGNNINYLWTGPGIVGADDGIDIKVEEGGIYTLLVTNTSNGCTNTAIVMVEANQEVPVAQAIGGTITCLDGLIELNGGGSSQGANFTFEWTGTGIVAGGNTLNPTVNSQGVYTLTVTNETNHCEATTTAIVGIDISAPVADIEAPTQLNCTTTAFVLDGTGSSLGNGFGYQWYLNGSAIPNANSTSLQASNPGNYQLEVENLANGCKSEAAVIVSQDIQPPQANASVNGQLDCIQNSVALAGNVLGNANDFSYQWTTTNGVFNGSTTELNATAAAPGLYLLLVTSLENGCSDTAQVQVLQSNDLPIVDIVANGTLDCNTESLLLDATPSSQGAGFSFLWSTSNGSFLSGQNSLTPIVNAPGTYLLTIFNAANNCQTQGSVTVAPNDNTPTITIPTQPMIDCGNSEVNIEATIGNIPPSTNLSYDWSTSDGGVSGPVDGISIVATAAGTYTLVVTNEENGCTVEATVAVEADLAFPMAVISPPDTINCINSFIKLNGTASSQGANYSYEWTTSNGSILGSANVLNPTVDAAGTYHLTITNNTNQCTTIGQVTVYENLALPFATAQAIGELNCTNVELNMSGIGSSIGPAYAYEWNGPGIVSGGNTLTPLVNAPGAYQLAVTNLQNGCSAIVEAFLVQNTDAPIAEAGLNAELSCQSNTVTLNGNGSSLGPNFIYEWGSLNGIIINGATTLQPTVNAVGIYELTVTDTLNGCRASDLVQVTPDEDIPTVVIAQAPTLTCSMEEVILNATASDMGTGLVFDWSTQDGFIVTGNNGLQPTVNQPGTYLLTVTNTLNNCSGTANVVVDLDNDVPTAVAGQDGFLNCLENSLQLNGLGSETGTGITYAWSTGDGNISLGANTLTPTVDQPGTYQLLVTNITTGCTSSDVVVIGQDIELPTAVAAVPDSLDCITNQVALNGLGSSTGTQFQYGWSTLAGNIVNGANTLTPQVNEPGTYTLTVTNTANSCTETVEIEVAQNIAYPIAVANANGQITCNTNTVGLNSAGSSLGNDFSYQWITNNGNIVSGANSQSPVVDEPGSYTLTITNSENGCSSSDLVQVLADLAAPQVAIAPPSQLTCSIHQVTIQGTILQGANLSYLWTTADGNIVSGSNNLSTLVDEPGVYLLFVSNNANGCTTESQTTVGIDTISPLADAGAPFLLSCNGQNNTLDGSGSSGNGTFGFTWNTLDGTITTGANSAIPTISAPGTYQLIVTQNSNGCTALDEVTVGSELPVSTPLVTQPLCTGTLGSVVFTNVLGGLPPYAYSINGGDSYSLQPLFTNLLPGGYDLAIQDANGCSQTTSIVIEPAVQLNLEIEPIQLIDLGDSIQLNLELNIPISEVETIEWTPADFLSCADCLNPMALPLQTISFTVTVIDKSGCEDTAPITILVKKSNDVYVPNAFSPNDDGINDKFTVFSNLDLPVKVKTFMVFSRWGESVYEAFDFMANDLNYGWDGYFKGEAMDPAVFVWYAEVEFIDGSSQLLKGGVTLVK
ncbi:MAG: choice-of-anchor L domain-containing protein [Saprospiraceae bacterium]|nr:choice-of-anchor L domain-containing protein [Saprospiraceae bacterium]